MKRWMLLFAVIALVAAACSSSSTDGVASLDATTDTQVAGESAAAPDEPTDEESLLEFATCMRDNGVPDFQDPIVSADGSVDFGFGRGGGEEGAFGGVDRDIVRAAFDECGTDLEGVAFGPGGTDFSISEFEDTFVEFAACMRDEGVQMDDPDFSSFAPGQGGGGGEGGGPFSSLDLDDPKVQDALEACQGVFGEFLPGGATGGGSGDGA